MISNIIFFEEFLSFLLKKNFIIYFFFSTSLFFYIACYRTETSLKYKFLFNMYFNNVFFARKLSAESQLISIVICLS